MDDEAKCVDKALGGGLAALQLEGEHAAKPREQGGGPFVARVVGQAGVAHVHRGRRLVKVACEGQRASVLALDA